MNDPDIVLGGLLVHDSLVLGGPSRLLSREVDERTRGGNDGALVLDGVLVELRDGGVPLEVDLLHVESGLGEEVEVLAEEPVGGLGPTGGGTGGLADSPETHDYSVAVSLGPSKHPPPPFLPSPSIRRQLLQSRHGQHLPAARQPP